MQKAEILSALPSFSKSELKEIIQRVEYLLTLNGSKSNYKQISQPVADHPLIDVIILYAKKYTKVPERYVFDTIKFYDSKNRLNIIAKELEKISNKLELDRRERIRLCDILLETGMLKLKELNRPLSFRSLLLLISEPTSLLLEAYPGYFGSDMFRRLVLNK